MEKPIAYACPLTHHRYGDNAELPEDEVDFVFEVMPEIQAKLDSGLSILMEIETPDSLGTDEVEQVESNQAVRTGRMAFVSPAMVVKLFGEGNEEVKAAFINKEVMDGLEIMQEKLAQAKLEEKPEQIPGDVAESVNFQELSDEQE